MAIKKQNEMLIHLGKKAQIKAQVGVLIFNNAFTIVIVKYSDNSDVFWAKNIAELLDHSKINDYTIKLEKK